MSGVRRLRPRRAARLHRLAAVLQRLGDEGQVPRHPQQPDARDRPRASSTTTRRRCSTSSSRRSGSRAHGVVGFFPANCRRRRRRALHRRAPRRGPRHAAPPAPAGGAPRRRPEPLARRLRRAEGDRAARLRRGFAVTAGARHAPSGSRRSSDELDDYYAILLESLADRLAEAFAERLHERVRKEFWGYAARRGPRQRGADQRAVRRHPPGARLSRLPRAHREADPVGAAGRRGQHRDRAHRVDGDVARRVGERLVLLAPAVAVLRGRPRSAATRSRTTPSARAGRCAEAERWLSPNLGYDPED